MAVVENADPRMDIRLLAEQLRVFFGQTKDAVFGHSLVAAGCVALLYTQPVDRTALVAWACLAAVVAIARLVVYRFFPTRFEDAAQTRRWARVFEVIALVSGGTFGILPILFLDPSRFEAMAWILLILAGLTGGALGTLSAYSPALRLHVAASLIPLVGVLLSYAELELAVVAILFGTMGAYFVRFSRRFEHDLVAQIRGRLENVDLAERMTRQGSVLRSVMQSIPDAIAVVDPTGRFVYHNDQFRSLFQLPNSLLLNPLSSDSFNAYRRARGDFDHVSLTDIERQVENWRRLTERGEAFGYERTLRDGRILRVDNHPMPDGGWVRIWSDVTADKEAAAVTERWSRLLQLTLDHIDQGLSFIDANGDQVMCNRRYCELLGLPDSYMTKTVPLTEIVAELTSSGELQNMEPELTARLDRWEGGEDLSARIVYERRQANGNWLLVSANRLPEGGHVRTFTDITSRKEAEIQAAERRELLEAALASVDQGVIMRDGDDNILVYNDRLSRLLDVPAELYANNASSAELNAYHDTQGSGSPEISRKVDDWVARRRSGQSVERLEYQRRGPHGEWLHVVFQPLADGREIRTFTDISEIKVAEEQLQQKTLFLEAVLGAMEQGVLVTDADGRLTLWNDRACEILSLDRSVFEGRPSMDDLRAAQRSIGDVDPADPEIEAYIARWKEWLGPGSPARIYSDERRLHNGRWMLVHGRKLPDGGTVRTLNDITERKTAEADTLAAKEDAERARERLRAAMDAMPAGVVIFDQDLNFQIWNETYKSMAGLTEEDLKTLRTFDRIAELKRDEVSGNHGSDFDFDAYLADRRQVYRRDRSYVMTEYWASNERHMEVRVNPIPTGGWVSVYLDMTDRLRAEQEIEAKSKTIEIALAEAEATRERIGAILQSIPIGVLVYDPDLKVEYWNDAYCAYTGFSKEVLAQRPDFVGYSEYIFREHDRGRDMSLDDFMAYRNRVYRSDDKYAMDFVFDKTGLDVQYVVSSLPDGSRVNVMVDITAQKRAERAALEARDAAQEATQAKSSFLAAMSHEIRTPMNAVLGFAEILEQSDLDDQQLSATQTIRKAGHVLLRIIDDILDFSKIEAGRLELEQEPVDLQAMADSVLDTVGPAAEEKEIDLALDIAPSTPAAVIGDPVRLHQILLNLVGNAVKFTDRGFVLISLSAEPDALSPSVMRVRFDVTDTGVGIAPDRINQLFQPFRQAEASTTRRFGGSGLGLSICDRLVALMGGRIGVTSEPGEGSTFWFEIPMTPSATDDAPTRDSVDLGGVRVHVVTRPGPVGRVLATALDRCGMGVGEGESADAKDWPADVDVVILDGRLAGETGYLPDQTGTEAEAPAASRDMWVHNLRDGSIPAIPLKRPVSAAAAVEAIATVLGRASAAVASIVDPRDRTLADVTPPTRDEALAEGRLILIVEDNATNRMVVERQLAILGFAAETAEDGVQALDMWRTTRYGLILTDCHMPTMDGYQLAEAIRSEEAAEHRAERTPIVALTANALVGEADRCAEAGMDGYLAKPVTLQDLGAELFRWLGRADETDASAGNSEDPASGTLPAIPIDYQMLEEILGSAEPDFVAPLLQVFERSYRDLALRMQAAIDIGDVPALREAAHAAKGAAANAAAQELRDALEKLESAAADGDRAAVLDAWPDVGQRGKEVLEFLATAAAVDQDADNPDA